MPEIARCDNPQPHPAHTWSTVRDVFACVGVRLALVPTEPCEHYWQDDEGSAGTQYRWCQKCHAEEWDGDDVTHD